MEVVDLLTWLRVERGRSVNTLAAYRNDLRAYVAWLDERGTTIAAVTEADLNDYVAHLRAQGRASSSLKRSLVAVRGLHRFLAEEQEGRTDPAADLEMPKVPKGLPKALSEPEVAALLESVQGDDPIARRDRAILEVLYGTGLRISELVGLSLGDLDLDAGLLRAFGKGAKERIVPVGRFATASLVAWLGAGGRPDLEPERWARRGDAEALFLNTRGGRLSRQGAWIVVRRAGEQVGLAGRLTPHVLRHSCATHMLDHGADIRSVQELLGHASISTTQVYTLVSPERLLSVYRSAHPRATTTG
ncbi:MAG: tyrosine recombinase XerD [Actinobacteria bacterium]|nr:tyrosine recombinase XerD [Actinomycetota bacterium]